MQKIDPLCLYSGMRQDVLLISKGFLKFFSYVKMNIVD